MEKRVLAANADLPRVTIFTTTKPFKGHSGIIQRNAITSWSLLRPQPQIIIFGNEEGVADFVAELGLVQIDEVACTQSGTPLISSMFKLAQQIATNPLMCFVNADIMLTQSFIDALHAVASRKLEFVMTGRRTLLDMERLWDFDHIQWEDTLVKYAATKGTLDSWVAMDYFAFPHGLYKEIPPFAVGRARWDNWMIYSALRRGIPVVEATHDLLAIHQNHDYTHLQGGVKDCFISPEGRSNQELYGLNTCIGTLDSTHFLKNGNLRRPFGRATLSRRLDTLPIFNPALARLTWPLVAARNAVKSLFLGANKGEDKQSF